MNHQGSGGSGVPVRYEPPDELVQAEYGYYPSTYHPTTAEPDETDWRHLWSLVR